MTWGRIWKYLTDVKCVVGCAIGMTVGLGAALALPWMAGMFCVLDNTAVASTVLGVSAGGLISVLASWLIGYVFYYRSGLQLDQRAQALEYLTNLILELLNRLVPPDMQISVERGADGRPTLVVKGKGEAHGHATATGVGGAIEGPPQPPPVYDRQDQQPDTSDAAP